MKTPSVQQVILTHVTRGEGTEEDPCRLVLQIHTLDGEFLAEKEPRLWAKGKYNE